MSDAERIGPTAHYTAYVWRRLRLPHAQLFATRTGAILYWGFFAIGEWTTRLSSSVPSMREYLEYRHRLIDALVAAHAPDCVVELGAGLTPRALAWAVDHGVRAVEIDLPAMARIKRDALGRAPPPLRATIDERLRVLDADVLADDFAGVLREAIGDATRPVVIAEGLLSYFAQGERARVLGAVASALCGIEHAAFVVDLHTATAQAAHGNAATLLRTAIRILTRRRRALDPYPDREALVAAFTAAGFATVTIVDPADHVAAEPRLRHLRSPAHVVVASV